MSDSQADPPPPDPHADFFADVLDLEAQFYAEGHALGVADGSRAGRIEGRVFGLEKGFEKFAEMGRLSGRATVWQKRMKPSVDDGAVAAGKKMTRIAPNERLSRHLARLDALTEAATMPTENSEDAVAAFDDRLKDAKAKAILITKIVRDGDLTDEKQRGAKTRGTTGEMEDFVGVSNGRSKNDKSSIGKV